MKIALCVLTSLLALAEGAEVKVRCSVIKVEESPSKFFMIQQRNTVDNLLIERLNVIKEITADDGLTVRYQITDKQDNELSSGVAPFCGADPSTEGGSISKFMKEALELNEDDCPIALQEHEKPDGVWGGTLVTDVDVSEKIFILMSLRFQDGGAFAVQYELSVVPIK